MHPKADAFVRSIAPHEKLLDLWAVWSCGTECSLQETRDVEELLTWKSDDYEVKAAISYDESSCPVFGGRPERNAMNLTDQELQTLRNMGNEAEAAVDEIERLNAWIVANYNETRAAILAERARCKALFIVAHQQAEAHMGRGDDCGRLARMLLEALQGI